MDAQVKSAGGVLTIPDTPAHPDGIRLKSVKLTQPSGSGEVPREYEFRKGRAARVECPEDFDLFSKLEIEGVAQKGMPRQRVPLFLVGMPEAKAGVADPSDPEQLRRVMQLVEAMAKQQGVNLAEVQVEEALRGVRSDLIPAAGTIGGKPDSGL